MVAAHIVDTLQTVVSRRIDITKEPAVVTVGQFEAGVRNNIIPDRARLVGTIRTFDDAMQSRSTSASERSRKASRPRRAPRRPVTIVRGYPVTINDPELTARMLPTLQRVAPGRVLESTKVTGAEDFTYYQRAVPGLFFFLGVTPEDQLATAATNHSPRFFADETALLTGVRALVHLTADYLAGAPPAVR